MAKRRDITRQDPDLPTPSPAVKGEVAAFLAQARAVAPTPATKVAARPRLVFALDATMSRQPSWDAACQHQAEMFRAAARAGGLSVQLAYFRGTGEARTSPWVEDPARLRRLMERIVCHGGFTQIGRILDHVATEASREPVRALVYVGDAMEENVDLLCAKAGQIAIKGVKCFMFLEGRDPAAERAFREIARLTGGALLPFDRAAAGELAALLGAVASYAAGGRPALEAAGTPAARRLLADLSP